MLCTVSSPSLWTHRVRNVCLFLCQAFFLSLSHLNQTCSVTGRLGFTTKVFASYICSEQHEQNRKIWWEVLPPDFAWAPPGTSWIKSNKIKQSSGLKSVFAVEWMFCLDWDDLYEVPSAAVNADVRQLQTDDFAGLCDDERSTGQLWPGSHKSEVSVRGQHVQASCKHHIQLWIPSIQTCGSQMFKLLTQKWSSAKIWHKFDNHSHIFILSFFFFLTTSFYNWEQS